MTDSPSTPVANDIATLDFEQAMSELDQIVRGLEQGDVSLDDAISRFERGQQLRQHCEKKLNEARLRVDKIVEQSDGSVATEPLEGVNQEVSA